MRLYPSIQRCPNGCNAVATATPLRVLLSSAVWSMRRIFEPLIMLSQLALPTKRPSLQTTLWPCRDRLNRTETVNVQRNQHVCAAERLPMLDTVFTRSAVGLPLRSKSTEKQPSKSCENSSGGRHKNYRRAAMIHNCFTAIALDQPMQTSPETSRQIEGDFVRRLSPAESISITVAANGSVVPPVAHRVQSGQRRSPEWKGGSATIQLALWPDSPWCHWVAVAWTLREKVGRFVWKLGCFNERGRIHLLINSSNNKWCLILDSAVQLNETSLHYALLNFTQRQLLRLISAWPGRPV